MQFSSSGVATVASGDKTVTVTVAGITTSSIVLATITLTGKVPTDTTVGWFVIG